MFLLRKRDAVRLCPGYGPRRRVLGDGDDLFASQGSGWQRIDNEIELLAKRG